MSRSDLILSLVKAGSSGDRSGFRRSLEALVADERGRQHHVVAGQLAKYLELGTESTVPAARPISATPESLVDELHSYRKLSDLVLPPLVRTACEQVLEEQHRADLLRSHGLEPRHRLLLLGPPGNGKTSLAEAIGGELSIPILRVRYDAVVGSFLGETASRLARVFDHARTRQCVLFFDEFDAIGKSRGDQHEAGEVKRVVNTLLMRIDSLPSYVVVVAATNYPELLDRAVWRRFQVRAELPPPTSQDVAAWLENFEKQTGVRLTSNAKTHSGLHGLSFAELEEFCRDVQRQVVLAGPKAKLPTIVRNALEQVEARHALMST
ncbi:MAG TPA: ATP-binding protein [Polyangiaceae bacterium]|nr:ATP-binding protein [Polyangiaceae bacterium]